MTIPRILDFIRLLNREMGLNLKHSTGLKAEICQRSVELVSQNDVTHPVDGLETQPDKSALVDSRSPRLCHRLPRCEARGERGTCWEAGQLRRGGGRTVRRTRARRARLPLSPTDPPLSVIVRSAPRVGLAHGSLDIGCRLWHECACGATRLPGGMAEEEPGGGRARATSTKEDRPAHPPTIVPDPSNSLRCTSGPQRQLDSDFDIVPLVTWSLVLGRGGSRRR